MTEEQLLKKGAYRSHEPEGWWTKVAMCGCSCDDPVPSVRMAVLKTHNPWIQLGSKPYSSICTKSTSCTSTLPSSSERPDRQSTYRSRGVGCAGVGSPVHARQGTAARGRIAAGGPIRAVRDAPTPRGMEEAQQLCTGLVQICQLRFMIIFKLFTRILFLEQWFTIILLPLLR